LPFFRELEDQLVVSFVVAIPLPTLVWLLWQYSIRVKSSLLEALDLLPDQIFSPFT
jgi:hypothetical protein